MKRPKTLLHFRTDSLMNSSSSLSLLETKKNFKAEIINLFKTFGRIREKLVRYSFNYLLGQTARNISIQVTDPNEDSYEYYDQRISPSLKMMKYQPDLTPIPSQRESVNMFKKPSYLEEDHFQQVKVEETEIIVSEREAIQRAILLMKLFQKAEGNFEKILRKSLRMVIIALDELTKGSFRGTPLETPKKIELVISINSVLRPRIYQSDKGI